MSKPNVEIDDEPDDKPNEPGDWINLNNDWRLEVSPAPRGGACAVAARATPPVKEYRRDYLDGADIVSRVRGGPYSPEALRKSDIERIYVGREARLADEDLIALGIELREADRRTLHQGPRPTRQKSRRRREGAESLAQPEGVMPHK